MQGDLSFLGNLFPMATIKLVNSERKLSCHNHHFGAGNVLEEMRIFWFETVRTFTIVSAGNSRYRELTWFSITAPLTYTNFFVSVIFQMTSVSLKWDSTRVICWIFWTGVPLFPIVFILIFIDWREHMENEASWELPNIERTKFTKKSLLNTERAYKRSAVCTLSKTRVRHGVNNSKTIDMLSQVKQRK